MSNQSEALRLADGLEMSINHGIRRAAAAELRRLYEAHDWQYKMAGERLRRVEKLEAQRDALLEALKLSRAQWIHSVNSDHCLAAIKAAEQESA